MLEDPDIVALELSPAGRVLSLCGLRTEGLREVAEGAGLRPSEGVQDRSVDPVGFHDRLLSEGAALDQQVRRELQVGQLAP